MGLARRGEQRTGAPATAKEGRGRLDAPAFGDRTGFLRERKALCTVVTVTVSFRIVQFCFTQIKKTTFDTVLFTQIKKSTFEILFIPFAGKAQIVLKEKKQKKKFSEPDFLRS